MPFSFAHIMRMYWRGSKNRRERISMVLMCDKTGEHSRRMLKKVDQQGRSERRPEAYPLGYVEDLNDARTLLADCFSILTA